MLDGKPSGRIIKFRMLATVVTIQAVPHDGPLPRIVLMGLGVLMTRLAMHVTRTLIRLLSGCVAACAGGTLIRLTETVEGHRMLARLPALIRLLMAVGAAMRKIVVA